MVTPNIKKALESNGVRSLAKNFLREAMTKDCVDAVYDAKLVYELLNERAQKILDEENINYKL